MPWRPAGGLREPRASGLSRSSSPQAPPSSLARPDGQRTDNTGRHILGQSTHLVGQPPRRPAAAPPLSAEARPVPPAAGATLPAPPLPSSGESAGGPPAAAG